MMQLLISGFVSFVEKFPEIHEKKEMHERRRKEK